MDTNKTVNSQNSFFSSFMEMNSRLKLQPDEGKGPCVTTP